MAQTILSHFVIPTATAHQEPSVTVDYATLMVAAPDQTRDALNPGESANHGKRVVVAFTRKNSEKRLPRASFLLSLSASVQRE